MTDDPATQPGGSHNDMVCIKPGALQHPLTTACAILAGQDVEVMVF